MRNVSMISFESNNTDSMYNRATFEWVQPFFQKKTTFLGTDFFLQMNIKEGTAQETVPRRLSTR